MTSQALGRGELTVTDRLWADSYRMQSRTRQRATVSAIHRTASASRLTWSGEAVVGMKMSSSQPAAANAAA